MRMSNANDTKQTKALAPAEQKQLTIKKLFDQSKGALAQVLPKHVTPERMLKVALTATSRNPDLLACKPMSLLRAVFQAGELGLEAGGLLGEGYLVPFKDEVQFIPGYRGLIKLARQSGQLASIEARVVYERDAFELEYGLDPKMVHKPFLGDENRGGIKFVYAIALLKDGGKQIEVMTNAEIEEIRKRSKASEKGPWVSDFSEMARKTVVRRICKYIPMSVELARALEHEAAVDEGVPSPTTIDIEFLQDDSAGETKSRTEAIKSKLEANGVVATAATEPAPAEVAS